MFVPHKNGFLYNQIKIKTDIILSKKQIEAYHFLKKHKISLLFGDTGSGKTEIYFKLFEDMINQNKTSIFLLPEISLTPQMTKRLEDKFGDLVAIWHSKITKKQKEKILLKIYQNKIKIITGARSALFLPLKNLGLIVVDEEHDDSYKSSSSPKYHARDMAIYMGKKLNTKVVLGSATPSISSYIKFPFFRLKQTYFKSKKEYIFLKNDNLINEKVFFYLNETLNNNNQAIVFLPTRANYKYIICSQCGEGIKCPYCEVGMSLHKNINALKCHYCNYTQMIPNICPKCNNDSLFVNRLGTAEVVNILKEHYKDKNIAQFDKDSITTAKKLKQILKDFNDKKIDILVGTQMLSKGHDYHAVKLAIIFDIDTILNMADFRARFKALSLLLQVSGRVARSGEGKVVIQTSNKDFFQNYIDDFEKFLKDEIPFYQNLYPPFKRLLKIVIANKNKEKALKILNIAEEKINTVKNENIEIIGIHEAPIPKIAGKYRFLILLRSPLAKELLKVAHYLKDLQGVEIDMDPINLN